MNSQVFDDFRRTLLINDMVYKSLQSSRVSPSAYVIPTRMTSPSFLFPRRGLFTPSMDCRQMECLRKVPLGGVHHGGAPHGEASRAVGLPSTKTVERVLFSLDLLSAASSEQRRENASTGAVRYLSSVSPLPTSMQYLTSASPLSTSIQYHHNPSTSPLSTSAQQFPIQDGTYINSR